MMRVEPADVTADWALLSLVGPGTDDALGRARRRGRCRPPDAPAVPGPKFAAGIRRRPGRRRVYAVAARCRSAAGPAGSPAAPTCWCRAARGRGGRRAPACRWPGIWAYEAVRVAARRPRLGSRPTTARCRPRSGWPTPRCTWRRAATGGRRRWPGCTTSVGRRAGWCCCTSTG